MGPVVIIEESGFRIGSDPLTMGSHELQGNSYPPLADQGQADLTSNGERLPSEFPLELLEDAQEGQQGQPAVVKGMEILPTDESSRPNHALRPAVSNRSQPISSTVASSSRLDPDYGASRPHLSFAAGKAKRNLDRPDFGAKVKARILGSRPGGTVVVSLVLENHAARDLQGKQLEDCQLPPHLMAQARDLVEAVEEVEQESDNQESFEEQRNHAERVDSEYRRELMRILRLHPGGVEIVAEMTPEQLRALAHKLGARNPKLRALMN